MSDDLTCFTLIVNEGSYKHGRRGLAANEMNFWTRWNRGVKSRKRKVCGQFLGGLAKKEESFCQRKKGDPSVNEERKRVNLCSCPRGARRTFMTVPNKEGETQIRI